MIHPLFRSKRRRPARPARREFLLGGEAMEERLLMSVTPQGRTTLSTQAEYDANFSTNSWAPVLNSAKGTGSYSFAQWSFFEFNDTSDVFDIDAGVSDVNGISMQIYNTATSGNYRPYAGTFSIYVIPNDSFDYNDVRHMSTTRGGSGPVGPDTLGLQVGGTKQGRPALGITGDPADWLVGTWSITDGLGLGYATYTGSETGSTATGAGVSGSGAVLGELAAEAIKDDLNNGTPLRFAVVAEDTSFAADFEGNYSFNYPQLTIDYDQAPKIALSSPTYTVTELDQNPSQTTPLTFNITRTANPTTTTTVAWAAANIDVPSGGFTPQSGTVTFMPGETIKPVTIDFTNITTTQPTGNVQITLSDPGQAGGDIDPVFQAGPGGTTATATINYLQSYQLNISPASQTVNRADGAVSFTVTRSGSGSVATMVSYTTVDGTPYLTSDLEEGNARAGRDYTATSGSLSWAAGDLTPRTITVPINTALETFAGDRTFSVQLGSPSNGTMLVTDQASATITTDANPDAMVLSALPTMTVPVEVDGPYLPSTNSWMVLNSWVHGSFAYASMPLLMFDPAGSPDLYSVDDLGALHSVRFSIYNTATTGGFGGTPGSFDLWVLNDDAVPDTDLRYQGGTGNTGPSVVGSQADPIYIGTAYFPNNQVGYNEFTFDNLSAAAEASLLDDLNSGEMIRFVITPAAGDLVAADWEGNWIMNQPILELLVEEESTVTLPAWLAPSSDATWDAATRTLTVNGPATIVADPGADSPHIVADGPAARLAIDPTTVGVVHLGGVSLSNGAGIAVPSVGPGRSHSHHNVVVVDADGPAPGTLAIDAASSFDLADNDLVLRRGDLDAARALLDAGRNLGANDWTGNGLTSSAAAAAFLANGFEARTLGLARNADLPLGAYADWPAGAGLVPLAVDDVLLKYTYSGDFTLDGRIDADDETIFGLFYDGGASDGYAYAMGDLNGDGRVDAEDETFFGLLYGSGSGGDRL